MLDEIEQGWLGPVQIFEHEHKRLLQRERFEEPADRPEGLLGEAGALANANGGSDPAGDRIRIILSCEQIGERPLPRRFIDHLPDRPVRDPLPVGEAATSEDGRLAGDGSGQLLGKPGLADPGRAENSDEVAAPIAHRALESLAKNEELVLAPHQRRTEAARVTGDIRKDIEQAKGRHALAFPLQRERLDTLGAHGIPDEHVSAFSEQDITWLRGLLEPSGDVYSIAEDKGSIRVAFGDHDLARVNARAGAEPHAEIPLELLAESLEPLTHLSGGTNRP